ncbi:MAG: flagellar protein FlaG [Deltaproteobacteria bacterium]|nr:flagellar protein FlaG [Deltaproteobacteria bacterium]
MDIKAIAINEIDIKQAAAKRPVDPVEPRAGIKPVESAPAVMEPPVQTRAVFAIAEDKSVVIQILDRDGNVVAQIPPEDYVRMARQLRDLTQNLFSEEA